MSETSLRMGYYWRQGGFPMRVGDSSVADGAYQFHTARLTLVMASVGVDTVKTLTHRLRNQYLAAVREQVAGTDSYPAEGRLRP